ncbi:helix-turn-helix domain-containing protein [Kitasatospora sp. NPDC018058]|uniref:helix-turn-helix domain-containing protein n=1 Tax=Kitasatospora sp. NPDC018058 TaxID=3364025 RepID=UPI0037BFF4D1
MDFEIRRDRKPQGGRKLRAERAEYFRLVDQGYSNKEASRLVGVHERTGREWRNGRMDPNRFRAPARFERAPATVSGPSRYLSEDERIHIADRLREKATVRVIAAELGRSPSTVSREIRRNCHQGSGNTGLTPPRPAPTSAGPVPSPVRTPGTPSCGTSSSTAWTGSGVRSRSARLYGTGESDPQPGYPMITTQHAPSRWLSRIGTNDATACPGCHTRPVPCEVGRAGSAVGA